ncbi:hypothetical protein ACL2XO_23960 [Sodalis sp. RH15]
MSVGSLIINEAQIAFSQGMISRNKVEFLAMAIIAGTNLLSMAIL